MDPPKGTSLEPSVVCPLDDPVKPRALSATAGIVSSMSTTAAAAPDLRRCFVPNWLRCGLAGRASPRSSARSCSPHSSVWASCTRSCGGSLSRPACSVCPVHCSTRVCARVIGTMTCPPWAAEKQKRDALPIPTARLVPHCMVYRYVSGMLNQTSSL